MKTLKYTAVVWKEDVAYVSKCPELGVASCGDSVEEAVKNLKEAVKLFVENAKLLNIYDDIEPSLNSSEKFTTSLEVVV
ncbi:MAG: type II toxin-antitoxin system HicB family antitoxin [Acidobacteria bacterium]|nr:type II toxin-antitoxin system HicB family antitoxin [Acidobacteriota bacterium]MBU4493819.1 type II toxin-antitoxin system HicB family antitoxin [Acidobacteriota bacterium]MCG2816208.1 type II toxin-antitoxin system HicB family antitoxin [Candidatus Aminicenantes bacterium]